MEARHGKRRRICGVGGVRERELKCGCVAPREMEEEKTTRGRVD